MIRWGMIGCGDVTEVKSGPGFQKAKDSSLVAVMNRTRAKADDYARRHGIPKVHDTAEQLAGDPDVDAVYIATHPASHLPLALIVAAAGKPCLVEKPMAMNYAECMAMAEAFSRRGLPLWVAFYRRALPRFLKVRELLQAEAVGQLSSVQIEVLDILPAAGQTAGWRVERAVSGAGIFFDVGSHGFDMLDFLFGRVTAVSGAARNTGGAYDVEDVAVASFTLENGIPGSGLWNFNADRKDDRLTIRGSEGVITTSLFIDADVVLERGGAREVFPIRNPPHVHQPLIQTIVDELHGVGRSESTAVTGSRASWALDQCVKDYYAAGRFETLA